MGTPSPGWDALVRQNSVLARRRKRRRRARRMLWLLTLATTAVLVVLAVFVKDIGPGPDGGPAGRAVRLGADHRPRDHAERSAAPGVGAPHPGREGHSRK